MSYYPQKIGENVFVGENAWVGAASVGSFVVVGRDAVIGNGCVIRDGVKILDGAIMVPGMVAPRGVIVGGRPARILGELPDGWGLPGSGEEGDATWVEGGELRELVRSIR